MKAVTPQAFFDLPTELQDSVRQMEEEQRRKKRGPYRKGLPTIIETTTAVYEDTNGQSAQTTVGFHTTACSEQVSEARSGAAEETGGE